MKKLLIILLLASCTKDSEVKPDFPIKFQSTVYSNGYTMKNKVTPLPLPYDFIALPSIAQGLDYDTYKCVIGNSDFSKVYYNSYKYVYPKDNREVKGTQVVSSFDNDFPATIYYQVVRVDDNSKSEIRSLNTLWKK